MCSRCVCFVLSACIILSKKICLTHREIKKKCSLFSPRSLGFYPPRPNLAFACASSPCHGLPHSWKKKKDGKNLLLLPEGAISATPALLHNPRPKLRAGAYNWIRLQNTARGHFMEDWNRRKGGEGTKDAFFLLRRDFFFHFADVCCPDAPFFTPRFTLLMDRLYKKKLESGD